MSNSNGNGVRKTKNGKRIGRPPLDIPEAVVEVLAINGNTNKDIANYFGCDEDTVHNRFSEILTRARAKRKHEIREEQMKQMRRGNTAVLLHLSKHVLGEHDRNTTTVEGEITLTAETLFNAFHKRGEFAAVDREGN